MKTHGPNSPQTIRGLRQRRSLRGLLDTRWKNEADLTTTPTTGPFGKQFHNMVTPSGTPYTIADQTGGRTFAPGTQVLVAIPNGLTNRAVLGGSPAGKKGGRSVTRNRRTRGSVSAESNQYAFGYDGVNAVAMLYQDGTFVSTRATIASFGEPIPANDIYYTGCILSDSSLIVGDGSAIVWNSGDLLVWDVEGAVTHSYTVPAGWTNPSQAHYQNGFLYWCEVEDVSGATTFDVRLRRSDTDFGNVSTLSTYTSPDAAADYGFPWVWWFGVSLMMAFCADADGAVCYVEGLVTDDQDSYEWHGLQIRFALSGSNAFREFDTPELGVDGINLTSLTPVLPAATIGTTSHSFAQPIAATQSVIEKEDDSSTPAANLWGASDLDGISVSAFGVGTGGATLQVHDATNAKIVRGIASGVLVTSTIDAFDGVNYPAAMYYFGD